jgi:hypothetical protein
MRRLQSVIPHYSVCHDNRKLFRAAGSRSYLFRDLHKPVFGNADMWQLTCCLHQQSQKINSRHCTLSESEWNYWPPLMVYLKANLWNLKMYTATVFEKKSKTTHAWKIFQWKVNMWNEMWSCEWKVSDSIVQGVNKTVNERLQTKWLSGQIQVRMCYGSCKLYKFSIRIISSLKSEKNRTFRSYPFKKFPA